MSNKGRVLTLVVKLESDEYPQWIMDSHLKPEYHHGLRVVGIAEGNKIREFNDLEERFEDARLEAMEEYD